MSDEEISVRIEDGENIGTVHTFRISNKGVKQKNMKGKVTCTFTISSKGGKQKKKYEREGNYSEKKKRKYIVIQ